jgi:hypothetical protein
VGKKLRVADYIIAIAIGVAIASLPFVLEGMGVKVPLFIWWFLEILAVLTIAGWLCWQRIKSTCLRLRVMFQDYRQLARIKLKTGKSAHIGYKHISSRFKLIAPTPESVHAEMMEHLRKHEEESKEKLRNAQSGDEKES